VNHDLRPCLLNRSPDLLDVSYVSIKARQGEHLMSRSQESRQVLAEHSLATCD
jgi:hypothetical protein